jgi:vacuolar-type H+-ATPase subunit I/STV1
MSRRQPTPEQMAKKVVHFRRVIKFRSYFGWMFTIVGGTLFGVGFKNHQMPLVMMNGACFFAYGLFMVWQTKRAREKLDRSEG